MARLSSLVVAGVFDHTMLRIVPIVPARPKFFLLLPPLNSRFQIASEDVVAVSRRDTNVLDHRVSLE
jgi:hypothetical protein